MQKRKHCDEIKDIDRKEDTKGMSREEQVGISRLRTGYTRATHGPKIDQQSTMLLLQHVSILYQPCFFRIRLSLQWLMCVKLHRPPKPEKRNWVGLNFEWKLT
jgi:hypothetical protein